MRARPSLVTLAAVCTIATIAGCGIDDKAAPPPAVAPASASTAPSSTSTTEPSTTQPTTPAEPKLGQQQITDLGTAAVYAVRFPVKASDDVANSIRDKGMQFAVADIKVCSNGSVDSDGYGFSASNLVLVDTDANAYEFWNVQVGAKNPNLTDTVGFGTDKPRASSCKRGWLTFQLPPKTQIATVEYKSATALA